MDNFFLKESDRNLIVNLEVLGSLDYNTKLYARGNVFVHCPVNHLSSVKRFLYSEDREITQLRIKDLVNELHLTISPINKEKKELYKYIYPIIYNAMEGLKKLKKTYDDDKTYVASMEIDIKNINELIKSIKNYVPQEIIENVEKIAIKNEKETIKNESYNPFNVPFSFNVSSSIPIKKESYQEETNFDTNLSVISSVHDV